MNKIIVAIIFVLMLAGCAAAPTREQSAGPILVLVRVCNQVTNVLAVSRDGQWIFAHVDAFAQDQEAANFLTQVKREVEESERRVHVDQLDRRVKIACKEEV